MHHTLYYICIYAIYTYMYTYIASYSRQAVHRSGDGAVLFSGERRNYNVPELYKNRFSLFFKDVDHVTYLPTYP